MKVAFRKSFARDLGRVRDNTLRGRVKQTIEEIENAETLREIRNIKKLRGGDGYYRIRIGDYRLGLVLEGDAFIFVRFLHRKDLYRYFP